MPNGRLHCGNRKPLGLRLRAPATPSCSRRTPARADHLRPARRCPPQPAAPPPGPRPSAARRAPPHVRDHLRATGAESVPRRDHPPVRFPRHRRHRLLRRLRRRAADRHGRRRPARDPAGRDRRARRIPPRGPDPRGLRRRLHHHEPPRHQRRRLLRLHHPGPRPPGRHRRGPAGADRLQRHGDRRLRPPRHHHPGHPALPRRRRRALAARVTGRTGADRLRRLPVHRLRRQAARHPARRRDRNTRPPRRRGPAEGRRTRAVPRLARPGARVRARHGRRTGLRLRRVHRLRVDRHLPP